MQRLLSPHPAKSSLPGSPAGADAPAYPFVVGNNSGHDLTDLAHHILFPG